MSGFLCFPVAEPTGKELEKNVSIVPRQGPWYPGRRSPLHCDRQDSQSCCLLGNTHSALGPVGWVRPLHEVGGLREDAGATQTLVA